MEPVGVESFLSEYLGEEGSEDYLYAHPDLKGSFVSFTHFIRKTLIVSPPAAIVPRKNSEGVDTMIPLVLRDGVISFLYIQVKSGSFYRRFATPNEVLAHTPEL